MAIKQECEALVDKYNIDVILSKLAEVCHEKAEHIRTNWQDKQTAKEWERLGKKLEHASLTSNVNGDYTQKVIRATQILQAAEYVHVQSFD